MLTNYHTHSVFCDGKDTPEEMALAAIEKGFDALGFSGHGYTKRDSSFCMQDLDGYISTVRGLQSKYADKIQIYLGVEEDLIHPANRKDYDYIISSSHYVLKDGKYYSVDGSPECLQSCIALFDGDPIQYAHAYYRPFCDYILKRKPDIIGHFDLITKFDELNDHMFLEDMEYTKLAAQYLQIAMQSDCIFEVNTGAIARGMRTSPYPSLALLHIMKKNGAKVLVSSDCHDKNMLDCWLEEAKALLRDVGFRQEYVLYDGKFRSIPL